MPYEAEEVDPPVDYYFDGDSGSSTNGSVGGYFADLQLEGGGVAQPPPLRFTPPTHHLPPPSPTFHSSSNLPLPSPLTFQYAPSFNHHRQESGWNSVNPFASVEGGEVIRDEDDDGRNLSKSTSAAGFMIIKSTEEGRTPQVSSNVFLSAEKGRLLSWKPDQGLGAVASKPGGCFDLNLRLTDDDDDPCFSFSFSPQACQACRSRKSKVSSGKQRSRLEDA